MRKALLSCSAGIRASRWVGLLLAFSLSGCEPADPLEAIRQQQARGDFAGSVAPLRKLVTEQSQGAEVHYLYGRALLYSGEASLATWSLREAMNDPEWLVPAGLEIARGGLVSSDFNEVVETTSRILEHDPEQTVALLLRAQAQAHWRKDPEAALEDAEEVLERDPEMLEAYEPRILALAFLGRLDEAAEALEEAGRLLASTDAPASGLAWHCSTTAILDQDLGEMERAEEKWRECLELYPADMTVVSAAVQHYEGQGEWGRSVEVLRAAHVAAPSQRLFRIRLADRLRFTGAAAEGEALLREATKVEDPRIAAGAWSDLAVYRHALGEHGAAAEAIERAIQRVSEVEEPSQQLLFRHADALVVAEQLDRALLAAEELTVAAQSQMIRGRVAQERGQPAQALALFDEALRVWPDNPFARYYAARAAEQLGDFDRALQEYRYALRIDVGATDARTRAATLLVAQGQPLLAYQLLFLEGAKFPLEPEGKLLGLYLIGRVAHPKQLQNEISSIATEAPALLPDALARGAEGVAETVGPAAALQLLRSAPGVDYRRPWAAPALRELVRQAHAAGERELAGRVVDSAAAAQPGVAVFHEIRGLQHELGGADPELARSAYERAVEIDPHEAGALAGLGRLVLANDPAAALAFFDRAAAADPSDPGAKLGAARALRASGQAEEAERRLDALLVDDPYYVDAASEVVSLDLERGVVTSSTSERARRWVRFGGGAEAYDRLSQVLERLGQTAEAEEAERRAAHLRDAIGKTATTPAG